MSLDYSLDDCNCIKQFGGNKLTMQVQILKFLQGQYLTKHFDKCKKEWKKERYRDERFYSHLFPNKLQDFPNK